jgi:hypothetical protein
VALGERTAKLVAILLVLVGLGFGLTRAATAFDKPWQYTWMAHNGGRYSLAARNFQSEGFLATGFVPDLSADGSRRLLYLHHPPLTPVVVALAREHLGFLWRGATFAPENRARFVFWLLSGVNVVLIAWIAWRTLGVTEAGLAGLLAGFLPMTSYYGTHVEVQGSLVLFGILLAMLAADRARASRAWFGVALAAYALGLLADWPAYYLALVIPLLAWLDERRLRARWLWFPALAVIAVALHAWQIAWAPEQDDDLGAAFATRSSAFFTTLMTDPGAAMAGLGRLGANLESMYPWPILILAIIGLVHAARERRWLVLGLCVVGLLHIVLFPAGAVIHDYWSFALLPGISLGAAAGSALIARWALRGSPAPSAALAIALLVPGLYLCVLESQRLFSITDGLREHRLGCLIRDHSNPTERVLTNGPYNPFDGQKLTYPEFSYYAERWVRGNVQTPGQLEQALREEPADLFLLGAPGVWPEAARADTATLKAFLERQGAPLFSESGVQLYRLR